MADVKRERVDWIARVYSHDEAAISDAAADEHLVERYPGYGMDNFVATFRPLVKLREARGPVEFAVGALIHVAPDLSFAELMVDGEVVFEARIRFESEPPHRLHYWGSYPPLAKGFEIRQYEPADAPSCVALERACPMELADGSRWVVDRGAAFNDYLELMGPVDAAVVTAHDQVVGFFSTALRPIRFKGEDTYSVYQHHYRVHPAHRAGSVSHALSNFVDPRRTFEAYQAQFPYSLIDPNNVHMQNVGFPEAEGLRVARLSVPVSMGADHGPFAVPDVARICAVMNTTHGERELFRAYDEAYLANRWSRAANFNHNNYRALGNAVIGVWEVNELNVLEKADSHEELRLSFALDYGFGDLDEFVELLAGVCFELRQSGTTHLSFMCDTRAPEYDVLHSLADDEQQFALHTLPWIVPDLTARTMYCDAVYS